MGEAAARRAAPAPAGDYSAAASQLEEALRLAGALEDVDAIAVNAVNLSIAYQRLGRDDAARRVLAALTDDSARPYSALRRSQAELRRAILDLAGRDTAG